MEPVSSANVLQVLAKLVQNRPQPGGGVYTPQAQLRPAGPETVAPVALPQPAAPAPAEKADAGVSVKAPEQTPAQDPMEPLSQEAAPNYQRALLEAMAQRNRLAADLQRLKAQLAAKGDVVDQKQADALVQDMQRLEQVLDQHIRQIVHRDALNRLGATPLPVNVPNDPNASLVAFVKNGQAALLLGRVQVDTVSLEVDVPPVSEPVQTPAANLSRVQGGELPPVNPEPLDHSASLLADLLASATGRAA